MTCFFLLVRVKHFSFGEFSRSSKKMFFCYPISLFVSLISFLDFFISFLYHYSIIIVNTKTCKILIMILLVVKLFYRTVILSGRTTCLSLRRSWTTGWTCSAGSTPSLNSGSRSNIQISWGEIMFKENWILPKKKFKSVVFFVSHLPFVPLTSLISLTFFSNFYLLHFYLF